MNKISVLLAGVLALAANNVSAADGTSVATSSPAAKIAAEVQKPEDKPEIPQGVIKHKIIADAPLPADFVLGKADAPVVIVEYASLSCPHCSHFHATLMPEIQKAYIDSGKVRYVLRQYPLNEPALRGAMLVNCVGKKQGVDKYYLFNKVLFDAQSKWAFDGDWQAGLQKIAAVGGISEDEFKYCITDTDTETAVLKAKMEAMNELKVPHTPYFFIGGEAYNDEITMLNMAKFIDAKLAKK